MKFELQKIYNGFRLIQERRIKEINSTGRVFFHEKSGALLLSLENDDDNKVFSISFRTPPDDSTGLPHILEHSVLCGSRKYPSKEPFIELVKGSLHTFLNAMTFPDKTMYPVASRNEKDFFNLMNVYLDAVLYPNIYKYSEIFMQEGWHYELDSPDREISYKGVVYNEMKGVFSTPESVLFRNIQRSLFPHTCYGKESGGDPDVIPELTLEKFLSFHKNYYHPSNSYIYLYGDGEILEQLKFINDEYLKNFDRIEIDSAIRPQLGFSGLKEVTDNYPIADTEDERDKSYLSLNFVVSYSTDAEVYMAFNILEYLLLETPAAPLKKALINAKLGKDVFGQYERSILQTIFSVVVKNSSENRKEKFKEIVQETLGRLAGDGIDKRLIEASINIKEFSLREADFRGFPKGLVYCIQCMDSWLYDADPFMHLEYEPALEKVKKALTTPYFESLINKYVLENSHNSMVIVNPEKGLAEKKSQEIKKRLAEYRDQLSEKEIEGIVNQTSSLKKRQMSPDNPEYLKVIPILSLEDINPRAEELPAVIKEEEGCTVLSHPMFTNEIAYINLFFDSTAVPQDDLPYITLLAQVMGKISTEKYKYADLSNEVNIHTGGIHFSPETFGVREDDSVYYPKFVVKSKALIRKLPKLFELLGELLSHTRFDEKKRLREIIQEAKSRMEMSIYEQGHLIAAGRLLSYFSSVGKYRETISGLAFYKFISEIEKNFDEKVEEINTRLYGVAKAIFNQKRLIVSVTASEEDYKNFRINFPRTLEHLWTDTLEGILYQFDSDNKNEGLLTPGKVQYVAKGFNFRQLGYKYTGSLQVLRTIASMDYLWNRVRVQGGAYGSFARFARNGNMYFCSYRDPNLTETLSVYNDTDNYLNAFDADRREMTKYIIGTISRLDAPLTPSMKGETATERIISHITQEDIQRTRDEVLKTGKNDIKDCADLIRDVMNQNYFCVIGNEGKIKENKDIFQSLISVFE